MAEDRSRRISEVHYDLTVDLDEKSPAYSGKIQIDFDLLDNKLPLKIDFFEGKLSSIAVNDQPLDPSVKKRFWIELPARVLKSFDRNSVTIEYTQEYSTQGQGLYRYVDPETKEVFLYSQFETFDANKFMPCFDQPDLRATLSLAVNAPEHWQVISTTRETETKRVTNGKRHWRFPLTPGSPPICFRCTRVRSRFGRINSRTFRCVCSRVRQWRSMSIQESGSDTPRVVSNSTTRISLFPIHSRSTIK